ncbi:MAG: YIP1 family protein [Chloroflexi bacterium]|nr:YIP1 family protein [Chloroflexota bacterium]
MNALSEYFNLGLGALFLREDAFEKMREDARPFVKGFIFIVLVAAVVALVGMIGKLLEWSVAPDVSQIQRIVLEELQRMSWYKALARSSQGVQQFEQGYALWWQVFGPLFGVSIIGAVTNVITRPIGALLYWLIYGVLAYLFARLLGGTARLGQLLGCTALAIAPEMLRVLQVFPYVALPGLSVWGLICAFVGIKVAARLSPWRAFWATILPFVVFALIAALFTCIGFAALSTLFSGGRS